MKKIVLLLMICCMFTACGTEKEPAVEIPEQVEDLTEEFTDDVEESVDVVEDETETEEPNAVESATITPHEKIQMTFISFIILFRSEFIFLSVS